MQPLILQHRFNFMYSCDFLVAQMVKCLLQCRKPGFNPWVGNIWGRKWQPTPVFLHGKIPWMQEPGGLQSMGLQRVGHN